MWSRRMNASIFWIILYPNFFIKEYKTNNVNAESSSIESNVWTGVGSNSQCDGKVRIRKDWEYISAEQKELFLQAIEESIDRGIYQVFVKYHADMNSASQSHETCAFILWHRRFLLAFENMLRSLDKKYACLAIPYWNVMRDYSKQKSGVCDNFGSCSSIIQDLGGHPIKKNVTRTYADLESGGYLYNGRPIQNLVDMNGDPGIVRGDVDSVPIPHTCAYDYVIFLMTESESYTAFAHNIQVTIHDHVHDYVNGLMPSYASPADPLFFVWHSFIDLILYVWEICNVDKDPLSKIFNPFGRHMSCSYTLRAVSKFPEISTKSEIYIKLGNLDVRDDPVIGKYFAGTGLTFQDVSSIWNLKEDEFAYDDLGLPLWNLLNNSQKCPAGDWFRNQPFGKSNETYWGPSEITEEVSYDDWMKELRDDLTALHKETPQLVDAKMSFLSCTLQGKQEIPSDDIRQSLLKSKLSDPNCDHFLHDWENNRRNTLMESSKISKSIETMNIDWVIQGNNDHKAHIVYVGDTVMFLWSGIHDVYIHPTGDCSDNINVLMGKESGKIRYTFKMEDIGEMVFACNIGSNCESRQLIYFNVLGDRYATISPSVSEIRLPLPITYSPTMIPTSLLSSSAFSVRHSKCIFVLLPLFYYLTSQSVFFI